MARETKRNGLSYPKYRQLRAMIYLNQDKQCARCLIEFEHTTLVYHLHHLDGNPKNNHPTNLLVLCEHCHIWVHQNMLTDGKNWFSEDIQK